MTALPALDRDPHPPLTMLLSRAAACFADRLAGEPGAQHHEVPDYAELAQEAKTLARPVRWTNRIIATPRLRRAHVERFEIGDQIAVLHVCIFPRPDIALPVFGFDVVAGQNRVTGAFLDLSPVDAASEAITQRWATSFAADRAAFPEHRSLPDWGDIFSDGVIAVRPTSHQEVETLFALGLSSLDWYLATPVAETDREAALAGQRRYIDRQRRNEHTFRMLRGCVGDALARDFIDRWLFPDPERAEAA